MLTNQHKLCSVFQEVSHWELGILVAKHRRGDCLKPGSDYEIFMSVMAVTTTRPFVIIDI